MGRQTLRLLPRLPRIYNVYNASKRTGVGSRSVTLLEKPRFSFPPAKIDDDGRGNLDKNLADVIAFASASAYGEKARIAAYTHEPRERGPRS